MEKLNKELETYINREIIPMYAAFDRAHNTSHVHAVIENSLALSKNFSLDINMVYTIAAYHDVGLKNGRENHEKNAALFLLSDKNLNCWFSEEALAVMAQAVKDHRASMKQEPCSIYGKIVAEADREINYDRILKRVIFFSLDNFPQYSFQQHFERCHEHMTRKYGENGYLKLYFDFGANAENLKTLRSKLADKLQFEADFKGAFDALHRGKDSC